MNERILFTKLDPKTEDDVFKSDFHIFWLCTHSVSNPYLIETALKNIFDRVYPRTMQFQRPKVLSI